MPSPSVPGTGTYPANDQAARALIAEADMRIEVVKRELNQGALAGNGSAITEYAAALVVAALDSFDTRRRNFDNNSATVERAAIVAWLRSDAEQCRQLGQPTAGVTLVLAAGIIEKGGHHA